MPNVLERQTAEAVNRSVPQTGLHDCSEECATLHREIFRKILSVIQASRQAPSGPHPVQNNWFNLQTAAVPSLWTMEQSEQIAKFTNETTDKQAIFEVSLPAAELDAEAGSGAVVVERWLFEFRRSRKDGTFVGDEPTRQLHLYKQTAFYIRAMHAVARLLPAQRLVQEGRVARGELRIGPFGVQPQEVAEGFDSNNLGTLSCIHGSVQLTVQFRRVLPMRRMLASPAIKVPKHPALPEAIIRSSPSTSSWVDMSPLIVPASSVSRKGELIARRARSRASKNESEFASPGTSSKEDPAVFIRTMEKVPRIDWPEPSQLANISTRQLIEHLDRSRSQKILFDRWLEEIELEGLRGVAGMEEPFSPICPMDE